MIINNFSFFKKIYKISESLSRNEVLSIPGFQFVSYEIKDDTIEIITSRGNVKLTHLNFLVKSKYKSQYIYSYKDILKVRYNNSISEKIKLIYDIERLEIFSDIIEQGGFLNDLIMELVRFGLTKDEANNIYNNFEEIEQKGVLDSFTQNSTAILITYLNYLLEIAAVQIYIFILYFNKESEIDLSTEKNTSTVSVGNILENKYYQMPADYHDGLMIIKRVVYSATEALGLKVSAPKNRVHNDLLANATNDEVVFYIENSDLIIISILDPTFLSQVHLNNKDDNSDHILFSVESQTGPIDKKYSNLQNEDEIKQALKELL